MLIGVSDRVRATAAGGTSDGCAGGGAGTIWIAYNGTLLVDSHYQSQPGVRYEGYEGYEGV